MRANLEVLGVLNKVALAGVAACLRYAFAAHGQHSLCDEAKQGSSMKIRRRAVLLSTVAVATTGWSQWGMAQSVASVHDFMALSARLTGFPVSALSAGVGALLFEGFQARGSLPAKAIASNASVSPALSAEIVAAWYSGVVTTPTGPKVVTHSEALVWHSAEFLHPPGQCGGAFGHWATPPSTT